MRMTAWMGMMEWMGMTGMAWWMGKDGLMGSGFIGPGLWVMGSFWAHMGYGFTDSGFNCSIDLRTVH